MDMTLVPERKVRTHFALFHHSGCTTTASMCWEHESQWQGKPHRKFEIWLHRGYSPIGTQSLHKSYSKHASFTGSLCCFSNNPERRLAGCPIMNKTADRNGKSLWRICKPKIPYVESEHFIYTFAWYFAHAHRIMEEIYGCLLAHSSLRPSPLACREGTDPRSDVVCSTNVLFELKGKRIESRIKNGKHSPVYFVSVSVYK